MHTALEAWLRVNVHSELTGAAAESLDEPSPRASAIGCVAPGDRIGEYRILGHLGRGGFGVVYQAEHEVLRRVVAIKVPHDSDSLPALRRSARIQASLDDPGIVPTIEASLTHDPPYVVFEHVDGPTLAELIPLPWARALPLLRDVARALRHAHAQGVAHGDVKPANVLVSNRGDGEIARLTDFGSTDDGGDAQELADQVSSSVALDTTKRVEVAGTVPYIAPEVLRGQSADERADVYAYGVLLFEVLTGHVPEGRELPSDLVPGIPRELDVAFDRCFARRERRAVGFDEILAALDKAAAWTSTVARPRRSRARSRVLDHGGPRRQGIVALCVAAILPLWRWFLG